MEAIPGHWQYQPPCPCCQMILPAIDTLKNDQYFTGINICLNILWTTLSYFFSLFPIISYLTVNPTRFNLPWK